MGLPEGDWALFGSGPLFLRGWITDLGDLDVIVRGAAWDHARRLGDIETLSDGNQIVVVGERITIGRTWAYGEVSVATLIDTAEIVAEVPCVRIEHIVAYKRIADRPKDRRHLAIIEAQS